MHREDQSGVMQANLEFGDCMAMLRRGVHGRKIEVYDEGFVRKTIAKRLVVHGLPTVAAYDEHLVRHPEEEQDLCWALRNGYSEFFRNSLTFGLLEQWVLPRLAASKRLAGHSEIRVWSAGCAAGQEAWSIAMLLESLRTAGESRVSYRVFATDLAVSDLALAEAGVYSAEAVGNVRKRYLHDYFSRQGESYAVASRLRARVGFSEHDLLDESLSSPEASLYGDFDVVFCCNLLFYYRADIRRRILAKVCRALSPGGYFVTGEAERDMVAARAELRAVVPPGAVFQKSRNPRTGVFSMTHIAQGIFTTNGQTH